MSKPLRELEITLSNNELGVRNYSAIPEDVFELQEYLQTIGISTSVKQFSFCG